MKNGIALLQIVGVVIVVMLKKNYQLCYFSFFDFLHYRAWLKKRKKRREKRRADSNLKEVLESVQDDIEIFKARIDNEIEDARRDAKEIKRRLNS